MSDVAIDGPTAGVLLRRARESAGLHVASLAASLKVPVRKLEALEQDRYDQLTDAVFARALASSVCRTLKIDAQPVLERLPQTHAPRLVHDHPGLNEPFRAPGDSASPGWVDQLTRPVFLAVFALLLGALVLVFLPKARTDDAAVAKADPSPTPMTSPMLAAVTPSDEVLVPVAASPDTVPVPQPSTSAAVPAATTAPLHAGAATTAGMAAPKVAAASPAPPASSPVRSSVAPTTASAAAAPTPAASAPAASGVVVFRTTGPSWVEVTDSRGTVSLRRLMAAGESAGASGNLPLTVTIGSVNVTSVQVRGKPYNLAPVSRDNVARFEVK